MRLFLCEKPSQGKDIGRILGATQRGEGCLNGSGVTITWCIGHLVEAAAPEVYDAALKRWSLEQLPIIPQQWRVEVKPKTATQFKVVKALLAKATHLVIATDADREGELIAREIIDLCGYRGPIERLWLSALNDASIRTALGKLRPSSDTLPMYYSALARSRADWLVGMNLSRLFTVLGRQAGYDGVLSVGRVQTPTLKLVVDRDREIAAFKSVPFWAIDVSLSAEGQAFSAQWVAPDGCTDDAGRCLQQPVAQQAAQQIRAAGSAQVVSVETERVREGPPLLFDLGTLAGGLFQAARAGRAGDIADRPGPVRDAQGHDLPALGLRLPARKHVRRGARRPGQPAQNRPVAAPDHESARPLPALARLERRQGHGAPRHHSDARTREPLCSEREGTGGVPADPGALPGAVPPAPRVRPYRG
jgi:DNA topoisomerase III